MLSPSPTQSTPEDDGASPFAAMRGSRLRWLIAFALLLAAVLNYLDRSFLGVLAPVIQKDLGLGEGQYATVLNFFQIAYTLSYLLSGRVVDKLGVRLSMALFIGWWSLSNALTGVAHSLRSLSLYRFMLGLGEAGAWTAAPKAVSEWFRPAERGVAIGIYSVGGAAGASLAPLLATAIFLHWGWRPVFAVSPVLACFWLVFWFWLYRVAARHPGLGSGLRDTAPAAQLLPAAALQETEGQRWCAVLREPVVWRLMLARLVTDPVWFFYQYWLSKYFHTARGVDQKSLSILWIVFLAADIGFLVAGFLSGWFIKRGTAAAAARRRVMIFAACITPFLAFLPGIPNLGAALALAMLVAFALTTWLGSLTAMVVDLMRPGILGTAFGIIACCSALGAIFMNEAVAWLVTHRSYDDCFYVLAFMHPLGLLLVWKAGSPPARPSEILLST